MGTNYIRFFIDVCLSKYFEWVNSCRMCLGMLLYGCVIKSWIVISKIDEIIIRVEFHKV